MTSLNTTFFIRNTNLYSYSLLLDNLITLEPIAIGTLIPPIGQSICGISIGRYAGLFNQGSCAIAIGEYAGNLYQGANSVAIGVKAGQNTQSPNSIVINASGSTLNGAMSNALYVAPIRADIAANTLHYNTSTKEIVYTLNPSPSILVSGTNWSDYLYWNSIIGDWDVGSTELHVGSFSGETGQLEGAVAIGNKAGQTAQGQAAVAIGQMAGSFNQSSGSVAIGELAGYNRQSSYAVALGSLAGQTAQGTYSIAIGYRAGQLTQNPNSIILNATGAGLQSQTSNALYIAPIRSSTSATAALYYDTGLSEIVYSSGPSNSSYYGQFYNTSTIYLSTSPQIIPLPNIEYSNGVFIVSNSRIQVSKPGKYQLFYIMQFEDNQPGDTAQVAIYMTLNGTNIPSSCNIISVDYNHNKITFFSGTYIVTYTNLTDFIQILVVPNSVHTQLTSMTAGSSFPSAPATPSVRVSVVSL